MKNKRNLYSTPVSIVSIFTLTISITISSATKAEISSEDEATYRQACTDIVMQKNMPAEEKESLDKLANKLKSPKMTYDQLVAYRQTYAMQQVNKTMDTIKMGGAISDIIDNDPKIIASNNYLKIISKENPNSSEADLNKKGLGAKIDFYVDHKDKLDILKNEKNDTKRTKDLQAYIEVCVTRVMKDKLASYSQESSVELLGAIKEYAELKVSNPTADGPAAGNKHNPTCSTIENALSLDKDGRRYKCNSLSGTNVDDDGTKNVGKLMSFISFDTENILPEFATENYCNTCIKDKFDLNKALFKNSDLNKFKFEKAKINAQSELYKKLQERSLANSLLKTSLVAEQLKHTQAWLSDDKQDELKKYNEESPCFNDEIIKTRLNEDQACKKNENKLKKNEILNAYSKILGLKEKSYFGKMFFGSKTDNLKSFDDIIEEVSNISDQSKFSSNSSDLKCKRLSREDYVKRSVANSINSKAYAATNHLIDEMFNSFDKKGFIGKEAYSNGKNDQTPVEFLASKLATDIVGGKSPLSYFFEPGKDIKDPKELKDFRTKRNPILEVLANDTALMGEIDKYRGDTKTHMVNIKSAITAFLSKTAKTSPHLYYLMNDKQYFLNKVNKFKKEANGNTFSQSIDPISKNKDSEKYSNEIMNNFKEFKNRSCKKFVDEMISVACPAEDFLDKFSNNEKRQVAIDLVKEKKQKYINDKDSKKDNENYLNAIAMESATCLATQEKAKTPEELKHSPLASLDREISPVAQSDFTIDLKEKLGFPKSKYSKNQLDEFAKSDICDMKDLDKIFGCSVSKTETNCNYGLKDIKKIKEVYTKVEENERGKSHPPLESFTPEAVTYSIVEMTDNSSRIEVEEEKESLGIPQGSSQVQDQGPVIFATNSSNDIDWDWDYDNVKLNDSNDYGFSPNPDVIADIQYSPVRKTNSAKDVNPFSPFGYKPLTLLEMEHELKASMKMQLDKVIVPQGIAIEDVEVVEEVVITAKRKPSALEKTDVISEDLEKTAPIVATKSKKFDSKIKELGSADKKLTDDPNSLLKPTAMQNFDKETLHDFDTGNMDSYNNRMALIEKDQMYQEMLPENSLQRKNIYRAKEIIYDEHLDNITDDTTGDMTSVTKALEDEEKSLEKEIAKLEKVAMLKEKLKNLKKESSEKDDLNKKIKEQEVKNQQIMASVNNQGKELEELKSTFAKKTLPTQQEKKIIADTNQINTGATKIANNNLNSFSESSQANIQPNSTKNTRNTVKRGPANKTKSIVRSASRGTAASTRSRSFNPIGILSSDGSKIDNKALDTYISKVSDENILDQSQLISFRNEGEKTFVQFNNEVGNSIEIDLDKIEDKRVRNNLETMREQQNDITFSEDDIDAALKTTKNLVKKKKKIIKKAISRNEAWITLKLLRANLEKVKKLQIASQN